MKIEKALASLVLAFVAIFSLPHLPGCQSTGAALANLEALSDEDAATLEARADLITRVLAARLLSDAHLDPQVLSDAALALELAAGDPLVLGGPNVLSNALEKAGFTNQEAILSLLLVEDFLRSRVSWGMAGTPLGPRARHLLGVVAVALRGAATALVTEAEKREADKLLPEKEPR